MMIQPLPDHVACNSVHCVNFLLKVLFFLPADVGPMGELSSWTLPPSSSVKVMYRKPDWRISPSR